MFGADWSMSVTDLVRNVWCRLKRELDEEKAMSQVAASRVSPHATKTVVTNPASRARRKHRPRTSGLNVSASRKVCWKHRIFCGGVNLELFAQGHFCTCTSVRFFKIRIVWKSCSKNIHELDYFQILIQLMKFFLFIKSQWCLLVQCFCVYSLMTWWRMDGKKCRRALTLKGMFIGRFGHFEN